MIIISIVFNVFTNYENGQMRVTNQKYIDWEHHKFTLWQMQLNFVVFCASSAYGVCTLHMHSLKPMIYIAYIAFKFIIISEDY